MIFFKLRFGYIIWLVSTFVILSPRPSLAQGGPASVVVCPAVQQPVAARQSFVANVKANRVVTVGSAVDGRVEQLLVEAGQAIKKGTPLSQLRTKTIEIDIAGAKAERDLRKAELQELQTGSRLEEIKLAEAQLDAAKAALEYAQARMRRMETMFRSGAGISQDEFEESKSASLRAAALKREAESNMQLVREGPRVERIEQAKAKLEVQEQVVAGLEDRLEKYVAKSPFDGFVIRELTEVGAWLKQGELIAEIAEVDPLEVEVFVPEASIRYVRIGDKSEVHVDAFPNQTFTGEVIQIVPIADPRARTFPVHLRVNNPRTEDGRLMLLPGMLAQASLPVSAEESSVLVPKDALTINRGTATIAKVVVTGKDAIAIAIPVKTRASLGGLIAVDVVPDGMPNAPTIAAGDLVVIRGNERLRFGNPAQPPAVNITETVSISSFLD